MKKAPIVVFVYNRLEHTKITIDALSRNLLACESDLFVFSDGAASESQMKDVEEVRNYIRTIEGFKSVQIVERENNWGLANNIIDGVTRIVNEYGRIIVVEDDILTSPYFLTFMNDALELYKDEEEVANVNANVVWLKNQQPEIFLFAYPSCWGWGTWARAWKLFEKDGNKLLRQLEERNLMTDFDLGGVLSFTKMLKQQVCGKNNSWAIRWTASVFLNNKLVVSTRRSLVENIGFDGSGVHCGKRSSVKTERYMEKVIVAHKPIIEDLEMRALVRKKYLYMNSYFFKGKLRLLQLFNQIKDRLVRS